VSDLADESFQGLVVERQIGEKQWKWPGFAIEDVVFVVQCLNNPTKNLAPLSAHQPFILTSTKCHVSMSHGPSQEDKKEPSGDCELAIKRL
jgi:hypothetical protein